MDNSVYLFAAFAITWAVLFAYVIVLYGRQSRIKKEMDSLLEIRDAERRTS